MTTKLILSIITVILSLLLSIASSTAIGRYFPSLPYADDVMFHVIPFTTWSPFVADTLVAIALIITIFIAAKYKEQRHLILYSYAIMWAIRALLNIVTPLGDPSGDLTTYGFFEFAPMYGMFPSGHTASIMLTFWWASEMNEVMLKRFAAVFVVLEALALWSSRGHYTIDIVGGIALSYFAVLWVKKLSNAKHI
jgi:membrane-associated phospholipid phosphatase